MSEGRMTVYKVLDRVIKGIRPCRQTSVMLHALRQMRKALGPTWTTSTLLERSRRRLRLL